MDWELFLPSILLLEWRTYPLISPCCFLLKPPFSGYTNTYVLCGKGLPNSSLFCIHAHRAVSLNNYLYNDRRRSVTICIPPRFIVALSRLSKASSVAFSRMLLLIAKTKRQNKSEKPNWLLLYLFCKDILKLTFCFIRCTYCVSLNNLEDCVAKSSIAISNTHYTAQKRSDNLDLSI